MFLYDALSYIQVTLLLFITAALGLKTIELAGDEAAEVSAQDGAPQLSSRTGVSA
jgi:hypothetical protein